MAELMARCMDFLKVRQQILPSALRIVALHLPKDHLAASGALGAHPDVRADPDSGREDHACNSAALNSSLSGSFSVGLFGYSAGEGSGCHGAHGAELAHSFADDASHGTAAEDDLLRHSG